MSHLKRDEHCFYYETDIHFYDCGKNHKARIETILRHTADVAGIAYTAKGYSHKWLWENGFVFLLSRVFIKIFRMPNAEEHITIETWEREVKGALFYRDVNFYDANGVKIISCATAWSLVNPNTRTILKPSAFTGKIDPLPEKSGEFPYPARLKDTLGVEEVGKRKIVYSDIDGNGHVYNAIYSAIACDFLSPELMEKEISEFQINFKQEAMLGEELTIKSLVEGENPITARVVGELGDKQSFICGFIFD